MLKLRFVGWAQTQLGIQHWCMFDVQPRSRLPTRSHVIFIRWLVITVGFTARASPWISARKLPNTVKNIREVLKGKCASLGERCSCNEVSWWCVQLAGRRICYSLHWLQLIATSQRWRNGSIFQLWMSIRIRQKANGAASRELHTDAFLDARAAQDCSFLKP